MTSNQSSICVHVCDLLVVTIMVTKRPWTKYQYCMHRVQNNIIIFSGDVQGGWHSGWIYITMVVTTMVQRDHAYQKHRLKVVWG